VRPWVDMHTVYPATGVYLTALLGIEGLVVPMFLTILFIPLDCLALPKTA
jgi:hypothetical protein